MRAWEGEQRPGREVLVGQAALIASVGGQRGYADWTNPNHRIRRVLAEFIGTAGLTFILSGGAAVLLRYDGHGVRPWQKVIVLSVVSALWVMVAVYFLGDISAHYNPVDAGLRAAAGHGLGHGLRLLSRSVHRGGLRVAAGPGFLAASQQAGRHQCPRPVCPGRRPVLR